MEMEDERLEREIDEEMGWKKQLKHKGDRLQQVTNPYSAEPLLKRFGFLQKVRRFAGAILRAAGKVVFFPIISPLGYSRNFNVDGDMMVVKRSWQWRLVDGLVTRLMLAPVVLGLFLLTVVYFSTHPARVQAANTPESRGIYYKRVRLVTADGQGLGAWYLPPLTADEMTFDPEASLAQHWPSVVICHGLGAAHDQYLGLAENLHKAGFAVLMVDTRGQGESDTAAVTYGLRERLDVLAGVKYLRELPNLDETKVCVVGHDIGAVAALQAATLDSSVAAVVADGMWPEFGERAQQIFAHPAGTNLPTAWLAPLYTVAFEVSVRDRLSQMDAEGAVRSIHRQPVLFVARQGSAYASLQDVTNLATSTGSHHEVVTAAESDGGDADGKVRDFLVKATGWKGAKAKGIGELEQLLKNRVK